MGVMVDGAREQDGQEQRWSFLMYPQDRSNPAPRQQPFLPPPSGPRDRGISLKTPAYGEPEDLCRLEGITSAVGHSISRACLQRTGAQAVGWKWYLPAKESQKIYVHANQSKDTGFVSWTTSAL